MIEEEIEESNQKEEKGRGTERGEGGGDPNNARTVVSLGIGRVAIEN